MAILTNSRRAIACSGQKTKRLLISTHICCASSPHLHQFIMPQCLPILSCFSRSHLFVQPKFHAIEKKSTFSSGMTTGRRIANWHIACSFTFTFTFSINFSTLMALESFFKHSPYSWFDQLVPNQNSVRLNAQRTIQIATKPFLIRSRGDPFL